MLFNSHTFLIFFLAVVAAYYSASDWTLRKLILLVAGYIFYAAWNPPFVLLLIFVTAFDWITARFIFNSRSLWQKRSWLLLSLGMNLSILLFFKYAQFALNNFTQALSGIGIQYSPPELNIVLPLGISFFTFQSMSYSIDVYRGRHGPSKSFLDYSLFVTFFPLLAAGPIMRADQFLGQCHTPKALDFRAFGYGAMLIIVGLFQKVVLADALLAPIVDSVFNELHSPSFFASWIGVFAFAGQIYCDFSGYSICAVGIGCILGFNVPRNFRSPYAAIGFSDFWQRWHISLSTWLRDYVYISFGGNKHGLWNTYRNLMATMLIGGLWHGANWTFVVWGGLHGLFLIIERIWFTGRIKNLENNMWKPPIVFVAQLATFLSVCITWVFFRAPTIQIAMSMLYTMFAPFGGGEIISSKSAIICLTVMFALLCIHTWSRERSFEERFSRLPAWANCLVLTGMLYGLMTMPSEDRSFIYFQF